MKSINVFLLFSAFFLTGLLPLQPTDAEANLFLLRVHLVDSEFLNPVKTFSSLHYRAGPYSAKGTDISQRQLIAYLREGQDHVVSVKAVAPDGRVAYDQRTIRYEYSKDPDRDGFYDLVLVLDFQHQGPAAQAVSGPAPEQADSGKGKDENPWAQSVRESQGQEGPSFEGLERTPQDGRSRSGAGETGDGDNPWSRSVRQAEDDEPAGKGLEETTEAVAIPRKKQQEIAERAWQDIPEGERRIILSGYELLEGDPDIWPSPAVIDPNHVVVAVQYANGESRVLDGEAAVAAMRERGFLEKGSYRLTPLGRKGWETPRPTEDKELFAIGINASATKVKTGESVTLSPRVKGGHAPYRYNWAASGKGFFSTSEKATLSWQKPGRKEVTLFVIDDYFREKSATITVAVTAEERTIADGGRGRLRLLNELTIPSRGAPVKSSTLQKGKTYLIEVSGLITQKFYSESGKHLTTVVYDPLYTVSHRNHHDQDVLGSEVDLSYEQDITPSNQQLRYDSGPYEEVRFGYFGKLLFEKYNPRHVYRVEYEGTGHPLKFYYYWRNEYSKGKGAFSVKIYEQAK